MDTLLTAPTVAITTTFQVSFGQNINNSVGQLEYFFTVDIAPIAGGAAGGAVLLIIIICVLIVLCYYHTTLSKYKKELKFAQQPVYTYVSILCNILLQ